VDIVEKPFSFDMWVEDFVALGFHSLALCEFERISRSLLVGFGHEIIHGIMDNETVGTIAELLLLSNVQHYSAMKTVTVNQRTGSGVQDQRLPDVDNEGTGGETSRSDGHLYNPEKSEQHDGEGLRNDHLHTIQTEEEIQKP